MDKMRRTFTSETLKTKKKMKPFPRLALLLMIAAAPLMMSGTSAGIAPILPALPILSLHPATAEPASSVVADLYRKSGLKAYGLSTDVFELAYRGFEKLSQQGVLGKDSILTIVDFTKSSGEKRMFVIDLKKQDLVIHSLVAHGRNSGSEFARMFSNKPSSNQSSLGFYVTRGTYEGSNGYSLKLEGLEAGFNDKAMSRAIVLHAADYANEDVARGRGYIGRSYGCPAVPEKMNRKIINTIKGGNALFIYYPDANYLNRSRILNS